MDAFSGPVYLPGDDGYAAARATWNGRIEPRPALVAEALNATDVQAAVRVARERDLPFAVQATGHGTHVPIDDGLLIKTSRMAEVLVDPDRRIAYVGPGARWGEVLAAAAPFGLAPVSGSSTTVGVAGYTLGGGLGWLSRKHGFGADSLLRADVVTADGRLVTASAERNSDLFWALRGGGGNFGIVTALELRLHPVGRVYAGSALYPIERAGTVLARYRDWAPGQPDALSTTVALLRTSPDPRIEGPVLAVRAVYAGEAEEGERALRPLRYAAGPPLADDFAPMPYASAATIGGTPPRQFDLLEVLPDAAIGAVVAAVAGETSVAKAVEVRHWGGAMARPDADAGPVGHRDVPFSVTIDGPPEAAAPLAPHATDGSFLNFLHNPARTASAYSVRDYELLRDLKQVHDPDNVLGLTHNIPPRRAQVREPATRREGLLSAGAPLPA